MGERQLELIRLINTKHHRGPTKVLVASADLLISFIHRCTIRERMGPASAKRHTPGKCRLIKKKKKKVKSPLGRMRKLLKLLNTDSPATASSDRDNSVVHHAHAYPVPGVEAKE